jgi:hypothetical protein
LNLEKGLVATTKRKASSSKRTTLRIEKAPTMLGEVLKAIIVEKETSKATKKWKKKKVLTSRVHNMRLPLPWNH